MPASFVQDGKIDREAAASELRRCLDTIIRAGRFHLSYRVDIAPQLGADDLETAEIVVDFDGPDRPLLLERNGDLLKALEHIAVRWLRLDISAVVTKGNFVDKPDLSKVDEIGFVDLAPGSGHGPGGWIDVAAFEVFGKPVKR